VTLPVTRPSAVCATAAHSGIATTIAAASMAGATARLDDP
jgi:hypothetical protein